MPDFDLVSVDEAALKTATGKRAQRAREYLSYTDQLGPGQAGRLSPTEGETVGAISRRLNAAAKLAHKELVISRAGERFSQ